MVILMAARMRPQDPECEKGERLAKKSFQNLFLPLQEPGIADGMRGGPLGHGFFYFRIGENDPDLLVRGGNAFEECSYCS